MPADRHIIPGIYQGFESRFHGARGLGGFAEEYHRPIPRGAGVKDLLIGQGIRFPKAGDVLGEYFELPGHGSITGEAVKRPNPFKNEAGIYFLTHNKNACI